MIERDEDGNLVGYGYNVKTPNPCPSWCVEKRGPGHGYETELVDGWPGRFHIGFEHTLEGEATDGGYRRDVSVDVQVGETADTATGKVVWMHTPELVMYAKSVVLTAAEARELSAALAAAADVLEKILKDQEGSEV